MLEKPRCELGYPIGQVVDILGNRSFEFADWISGQTVGVCDGRKYNHETKEYESSSCAPEGHGPVIYPWDLQRFIDGRSVVD